MVIHASPAWTGFRQIGNTSASASGVISPDPTAPSGPLGPALPVAASVFTCLPQSRTNDYRQPTARDTHGGTGLREIARELPERRYGIGDQRPGSVAVNGEAG